jgi:acyl-CoA thioesterase FadM
MGDWLETYRGTVYRWEVDNVDHFTVAYYFQRFEDATAAILAEMGLDGSGRGWIPAACQVRYLKELRVGDILHIRSGVIAADEHAVTLGHQVLNSASGDLCTTAELRVRIQDEGSAAGGLGAEIMRAAEALRIPWDSPGGTSEDGRPATAGDGFVESARDAIKPWEIAASGRAALSAYIHRFSAANAHVLAAFGMTPAYFRDERRGFSTFEFRLTFGAPLGSGDLVSVKSALLHVGSSSMRLMHHMTSNRADGLVATLEQAGVHLDLEARRASPLPPPLRERARNLLIAAGQAGRAQ